MYAGSGFKDWEIGDVEVHVHNGTYHLFHLIIPNHDYIAHAVSKDGITWDRVNNALFVGHPGAWDDDMIWTMDVDDCDEGGFEMYYTGLHIKEKGVNQKIGKAVSKDLITWDKVPADKLLIESEKPFYECLDDNKREWLSFRDPFKYIHNNETYLLICARVNEGPISRRGCVGLYKLIGDKFIAQKTLLYPRAYDDIECPCLIELNGRFYLIGSIREDIKVRYWHCDEFLGDYQSFHHDVLMPQGNYAARIVKDGDHNLIYNFYYQNRSVDSKRLLPPPKELDVDERGRLRLVSFYRWKDKVTGEIKQNDFKDFTKRFQNPTANFNETPDGKFWFSSKSGYELFTIPKPSESFIWEGTLNMEGLGKCGLLLNVDEEGNGYYLSLDFVSGYVQIRAWGFNDTDVRNNFVFKNIQTNQFSRISDAYSIDFKLIYYGHYIELSINGIVKLTLVDFIYELGEIGVYSSSSVVSLENSVLKTMRPPSQEYANEVE